MYFSQDQDAEKQFESLLSSKLNVEFYSNPAQFLGMKIHTVHTEEETTVYLNQQAIAENLVADAGLDHPHANPTTTPYRSGLRVDKTSPNSNLPPWCQAEC